MYRFVKDSTSSRLFVQGTREGSDRDNIYDNGLEPDHRRPRSNLDDDLEALHTRRKFTSEVEGSNEESSRVLRNRSEGRKMITTRIIRKTTTLTRGEEQTVSESLMHTAGSVVNVVPIRSSKDYYPAIQSKKQKVR
ncbi:hypothetical protein RUM44_002207 [Polyplax serrata]|uniref:Uncharacterized protein n=1 Tax=Polyplax serrata TaxID=468196 RepID=A0ABR1AM70_POLSC